jgi:hypothetical protein
MTGNTFNAGGAGATGSGNAIVFDQISTNARYYFPGYAGSQNGEGYGPPSPITPGTASANLNTFLHDVTRNNTSTNGPFPNPTAGAGSKVDATLVVGVLGTSFTLPVPLMVSSTASPTSRVDEDNLLADQKIERILDAAINRWSKSGASKEQIKTMRSVAILINDIPGNFIASSENGSIKLDKDGGGYGWYFDRTPDSDEEFVLNKTTTDFIPTIDTKGKIDLLTVLMHELGHQAGLEDEYQPKESKGLMYGYINPGERKMPTAIQKSNTINSNIKNN